LTLSHSIFEKGYFFLWPMMRQTVAGIYHTFLTLLETKDEAYDLRDLLLRITAFFHLDFIQGMDQEGKLSYFIFQMWSKDQHSLEQSHHLPDLTSFDQVITLLHLLNVIILGPILYRPFYLTPHTIANHMFQTWANGQEQALAILQHINSHYAFYMDKRKVPFQSIVHAFLSHQIRYLVKQVWLEEQRTVNKANCLSSEQFIQVIAVLFSESNWLLDSLARHRRFKRPADSYEWYDKTNYTVSADDRCMVENGELKWFLLDMALTNRYISVLEILPKVPGNIWFRVATHSMGDLIDEMQLLFC
jgi:hypothetical protein